MNQTTCRGCGRHNPNEYCPRCGDNRVHDAPERHQGAGRDLVGHHRHAAGGRTGGSEAMNEELKRLLELAANAIGHELHINKADAPQLWKDGEYVRFWSPEDDDGDALRLAVKLGLLVDVDWNAGTVTAVVPDRAEIVGSLVHVESMSDGSGGMAATRMAVLRAAAAIGEAMP